MLTRRNFMNNPIGLDSDEEDYRDRRHYYGTFIVDDGEILLSIILRAHGSHVAYFLSHWRGNFYHKSLVPFGFGRFFDKIDDQWCQVKESHKLSFHRLSQIIRIYISDPLVTKQQIAIYGPGFMASERYYEHINDTMMQNLTMLNGHGVRGLYVQSNHHLLSIDQYRMNPQLVYSITTPTDIYLTSDSNHAAYALIHIFNGGRFPVTRTLFEDMRSSSYADHYDANQLEPYDLEPSPEIMFEDPYRLLGFEALLYHILKLNANFDFSGLGPHDNHNVNEYSQTAYLEICLGDEEDLINPFEGLPNELYKLTMACFIKNYLL